MGAPGHIEGDWKALEAALGLACPALSVVAEAGPGRTQWIHRCLATTPAAPIAWCGHLRSRRGAQVDPGADLAWWTPSDTARRLPVAGPGTWHPAVTTAWIATQIGDLRPAEYDRLYTHLLQATAQRAGTSRPAPTAHQLVREARLLLQWAATGARPRVSTGLTTIGRGRSSARWGVVGSVKTLHASVAAQHLLLGSWLDDTLRAPAARRWLILEAGPLAASDAWAASVGTLLATSGLRVLRCATGTPVPPAWHALVGPLPEVWLTPTAALGPSPGVGAVAVRWAHRWWWWTVTGPRP